MAVLNPNINLTLTQMHKDCDSVYLCQLLSAAYGRLLTTHFTQLSRPQVCAVFFQPPWESITSCHVVLYGR